MEICKELNLLCTNRMAIEAVLVSRGRQLENSENFDFRKMLQFLLHKKSYMPPADDPKAEIRYSKNQRNSKTAERGWATQNLNRSQVRSQ